MYLKIHGFGIEYNPTGDRNKTPVVLIHGFPFSSEMWQPQVEALKENYYVITYDVRGHGISDVGSGQYMIEYFVDDYFGLLDNLSIPKAVVVGFSMGGYIALRAIEKKPDRFLGLVLCDTRSDPDSNELKIKRAMQARNVKIYGMKKFANNLLPSLFFERTFKKNPDIIKIARGIIEKTSSTSISGTLIALAARTDTTPSLPNIKVPTLILVGQFDELAPPAVALAMKDKIPNAEMHVIPDAAHMSNLENPAEFNNHLLNFLKKIK